MLHPALYQKTAMMYNTWFAKRSRKRLRPKLRDYAGTIEFVAANGIAFGDHASSADLRVGARSRSRGKPIPTSDGSNSVAVKHVQN